MRFEVFPAWRSSPAYWLSSFSTEAVARASRFAKPDGKGDGVNCPIFHLVYVTRRQLRGVLRVGDLQSVTSAKSLRKLQLMADECIDGRQ